MTTKEIKLLAQDLLGRQFSGVKFEYINRHGKTMIQNLDSIIHIQGLDFKIIGNKETVDIINCKPFLFPPSVIDEGEIEFYGKMINPLEELEKKDAVLIQRGFLSVSLVWEIINYPAYYDTLDNLHVDYRGLIYEDLAIPVDKNNNPYK